MKQSILELIGNTPLLKLNHFSDPNTGSNIFAKLEMFNPTLSIKDRIVLHMIEEAEKKGVLKPHATIVEASSGNTGTSLAMIGSIKGYRVIITTPAKTSDEKIALMRAYGADVRICPNVRHHHPEYYITQANAIVATIPGALMLNQYNNLENTRAHYLSTAQEIWAQTDGKIDYLVACASTGGTISGVGQFLKEKNPALKIIMPDPEGSGYFDYFYSGKIEPANIKPYQVEGAGKDYVCDCMDFSMVDEVIQFSDQCAFDSAKELALKEGIMAGGTSGGALSIAQKIAAREKDKKIVVILPDSGIKYLSKIWNV